MVERRMTEDPEIIRLNIRHYQELLKLDGTAEAQQQVMKLLAEAQAQLPFAEAESRERRR
jgi:anti-sigma-K factor RskA